MIARLTFVFLMLAAGALWAAPPEPASAEIEHLLSYLAGSDCAFNRNGTWYSAARAVGHLRGKYDYLQKRRLVSTAESFIDRAASRSSLSGKAYLVRCGNAEPVESGGWFLAELLRYRGTNHPDAIVAPSM